MAVTQFNTISSSLKIDGDGVTKTYTVIYEARTDDAQDGPKTVMSHASAPDFGDAYAYGNETDAGALFRSAEVNLRQVENTRKLWRINATFDSKPGAGRPQTWTTFSGPLDEPARWSGSFFQTQKIVEKDVVTGEAITASSGVPFDPPHQVDQSHGTILVQRNEANLSYAIWEDFCDSVNNTLQWIFEPRRLKLHNVSWQQMDFGDEDFYEVTYEFHVAAKGTTFLFEPLDQSMYKLGPDGCTFEHIKDRLGAPVAQPVLLNGAGAIKACVGGPVTRGPYAVIKEKNFSGLSLPATLGARF